MDNNAARAEARPKAQPLDYYFKTSANPCESTRICACSICKSEICQRGYKKTKSPLFFTDCYKQRAGGAFFYHAAPAGTHRYCQPFSG